MTTLDGTVDLARDRELVERCQEGDERAFVELYERYQRRLHRFCLRRLHASDDAEEAVQEAFARAWRALPRFAGERRFYPWLTVIAGNVCTDILRRRSRLVPMGEVPARDVDAGNAEIDEQLLRQVDLALASEALGNLSDRHQRVLRLREATEWSAQRIAEHEGLAAPAVDTLLWRARQAFKREFVALSEAGGLAAFVGFGVSGLRRSLGRFGARLSSVLTPVTSAPRGPGTIVATVAITGAAVTGGGIALVGQGPAHTAPRVAIGSVASPSTSSTGATGATGATGLSGATTATGASPGRSGLTLGNLSVGTLVPLGAASGARGRQGAATHDRANAARSGRAAIASGAGDARTTITTPLATGSDGLARVGQAVSSSAAAPAASVARGAVQGAATALTTATSALTTATSALTTATSALTTATSALTTATSTVGTVLEGATGHPALGAGTTGTTGGTGGTASTTGGTASTTGTAGTTGGTASTTGGTGSTTGTAGATGSNDAGNAGTGGSALTVSGLFTGSGL